MRRGPKPQSPEVKAQKRAVRSKQRGKLSAATGPATPTSLTAPAWLKDEGLKIWKRLAPRLSQAKLLAVTDRETFGRYCRNFARWLTMQDALDAGTVTYTVETASGVVHRARPEFMIADRIERQLLAAEDRFGLNPAERQRIYAARANTGLGNDLFGGADKPKRGPEDTATTPSQPAEPSDNPVGLLN